MAKTETQKTYTTVTDVPIFRVGQWHPVQGDGTVTMEMLEQILAAANDDRLDPGVIKIGHFDDRFDNPDYFEKDGEPAYGQVTNLRITDDEGGTLYGDFINIPEELATVMASAYPYRSVEITPEVFLQDAEGNVVAEFPFVLTGIALLGSVQPAVSGLGAVHEAFSGKGKRKVLVGVVDSAGHFALAGGHTFESLRGQLRTALETRIQPTEYLWVNDLDDSMVIYEHETANGTQFMRESFTINADGTVALSGQPEAVVRRTVFEPVAQNASIPHFKSGSKQSVRVHKPAVMAAKHATQSKEDIVTPEQIKALREQGLISAEVTDEAVLAAVAPAPAAEEAGESGNQTAGDETAGAETAADAGAGEQLAASKAAPAPAAPETVQMSAAQFANMQKRLSAAEATILAAQKAETQRRHDEIIAGAKREGRIHPQDEANYRALLCANEEQTTTLLAGLQPVIHTREIGAESAAFAVGTDEAALKAQMQIDAEFLNGGSK
ncbi:hypothetical protein [Glutamicibacter sp. TV12E]|uniref:hypothetical protein n=1 Tax=Glutamicibacter sp. TV12E TaxID=3446362 RepID=UPI004033A79C